MNIDQIRHPKGHQPRNPPARRHLPPHQRRPMINPKQQRPHHQSHLQRRGLQLGIQEGLTVGAEPVDGGLGVRGVIHGNVYGKG